MRWFVSAVLVALVGLTHVASAAAQNTTVAVLGLTSLEGDDAYAGNLSAALRRAASQVRGWSVTDRDVPLSRMELANGCDATELTCLAQIANTMGVQRLVYGTMQHGEGTPMMYRIHIAFFDANTSTILHQMDVELSSARDDIDDMREPARRYVSELAGVQEAVAVTPPTVDVTQDTVPVMAEPQTPPPPASEGGGTDLGRLNWPAFALLLVAAGAGVGIIVSGLQALEDERDWAAVTNMTPTPPGFGSTDLCADANRMAYPAADRACGSNAQLITNILIGVAGVAGATGVVLLAINGFESPAPTADNAVLRIRPSVGMTSASLQLSLDF